MGLSSLRHRTADHTPHPSSSHHTAVLQGVAARSHATGTTVDTIMYSRIRHNKRGKKGGRGSIDVCLWVGMRVVVEDIGTDYKGRDNRELRRVAMSLARPWILLCTVEYSRIGHNKRGKKGVSGLIDVCLWVGMRMVVEDIILIIKVEIIGSCGEEPCHWHVRGYYYVQ